MFLHLKRYLGIEMLPLTRTITGVFEAVGDIINASLTWTQLGTKKLPTWLGDTSNEQLPWIMPISYIKVSRIIKSIFSNTY